MRKRFASRKQRDPSRCTYSKLVPRPEKGYAEVISRDRDGTTVKARTEIVDPSRIVTVFIEEGRLVDYAHLVSVTFPDVSNARGRFAFNCRIHSMKHRQVKADSPGCLTYALYPTSERQLKNFVVGLGKSYFILTQGKRSERYSTHQHRLPSAKYDSKGDHAENKIGVYRNGQRIRRAVDRSNE